MRTKNIAVFSKKLLTAAIKAREKLWKSLDKRFGKDKAGRDKYLESGKLRGGEFRENCEEVVNSLFLKFKGEPYETHIYKIR